MRPKSTPFASSLPAQDNSNVTILTWLEGGARYTLYDWQIAHIDDANMYGDLSCLPAHHLRELQR